MSDFDAVVVGGGHNGLAAACMLGRTGRKTLVLEARDNAGGLCAGEMFHSGYWHVGVHHDADTVRPWLVDALQLEKAGLTWRDRPPLFLPAAPGETPGSGLLVAQNVEAAKAELVMVGDSDGYVKWRAVIETLRPIVQELLDAPAPRIGQAAPLFPLLQQALRVRRMGADPMLEFTRVLVSSAEDWLSEFLKHPRLRAGLTLGALVGSYLGPLSPQSAGAVLLREAVSGREVVGGPSKLVEVLLTAARSHGVEIQTGVGVASIQVERGVVRGITLRDGTSIETPLVVSALDPRRTLLDLVTPLALPPLVEDEVRAIRVRATSAKLHLALSRVPRFACREGWFERVAVTGEPHDLERAFDDAKHGRLPKRPALDIRIPTVADPTLAPPGHHVLSAHVFGVPFAPEGGWSQASREQLLDNVLAVLGRVDPTLASAVVAAELLVPPEMEARYGITGGHTMHGEHALDQFWVARPGRLLSGHSTPIKGLFLASGGTHPYGGASGAAGLWAAQRAVEAG